MCGRTLCVRGCPWYHVTMSTLEPDRIQSALDDLDGWRLDGDRIVRQLSFDAFLDAIGFINRVAELAEEANHHPELCNTYTSVEVVLTTHSDGGVTEKDLDLASRIDGVVDA
jgi:4a-hydroxytetrahydrobiopterin dehydratase